MKIEFFSDMKPCRLVISYRLFGGACCLYLQGRSLL